MNKKQIIKIVAEALLYIGGIVAIILSFTAILHP